MTAILLIMVIALLSAGMDTMIEPFFLGSRIKTWNQMFWRKDTAWVNKWKNGDKSQGEKFWGSSTVFVMFMDGWHLFKALMIFCTCLLPFTAFPIVGLSIGLMLAANFLIFITVYFLTFELSYRLLTNKI